MMTMISPGIFNVSIHASARDATIPLEKLGIQLTSFNPRIREGCDSTLVIL